MQHLVLVVTALIDAGLGPHLVTGEVLASAPIHFILLLLLLYGPSSTALVVIACRLAIFVDVVEDQVLHLLQLAGGDIHWLVHDAPAQERCAGRLRQASLVAYMN